MDSDKNGKICGTLAQLVESRIVIPVVVGSSPISHPRMSSIMVVRLLHTESGGSSTLLSSTT